MGAEFTNHTVELWGRTYRVCFRRGRERPMIVARKTKHGEVGLDIDGHTARAVTAKALEAI